MSDTITDEQVLANPGDYNVSQVIEVFGRSSAQQVAECKAIEAEGKKRPGILTWQPAPPEPEPVVPEEPRFSRERVLDPSEGPRISGYPHHVIVGALVGDDSIDFSRADIQAKVERLFGRPSNPEEA